MLCSFSVYDFVSDLRIDCVYFVALNSAKTGTMPAILETDDVEAAVAKAVAAGAVKVEEEEEDVSEVGVKGKVTDPFGFTWIFVAPAKKSEKEGNKEV